MTNYFETIGRHNADQIINLLVDRFPDIAIAKINYWERDDAVKRFYINAKDGSEDKSFNLNIKERMIFINDYDPLFWNNILGVDSEEIFHKELMKLIDEVLSNFF